MVSRYKALVLILAGGRCPPDAWVFCWGGNDPSLNKRPQHLIEAAPFGRLDQCDERLFKGALPPSQKSGGLGGSAPQPKMKNFELPRNRFLEKLFQEKQLTVCTSCMLEPEETHREHGICGILDKATEEIAISGGQEKYVEEVTLEKIKNKSIFYLFDLSFFRKVLAEGRCPSDPAVLGWGQSRPRPPPP